MARQGTAKAPTTANPFIITTKTAKGGKSAPTGELAGHQALVDRVIAAKEDLDSAETALKMARSDLEPLARVVRQDTERQAGTCVKGVICVGTARTARLTWTNRFKGLPVDNLAILDEHLGDARPTICRVTDKIAVREGVTWAALEKEFGARLAQFFERTQEIAFVDSAMEVMASLRPSLDRGQQEALDKLLTVAQYAPSLNVKG